MKHLAFLSALFLTAACASQNDTGEATLTDYVNPFIGTGGHGHVFLGANVPFGMVQLGPSEPTRGWDWCSGYHYSDSVIVGFSHTHLSGTGIGDLGDITFFPSVNPSDTMSLFSHDSEIARPGYYKVRLDNSDIVAELTATNRTGFHRYSFPKDSENAYITINLKYGIGWDKPVDSAIKIDNDSTVSGYRYSTGWAKDQKIYFSAVFSQPFYSAEGDSSIMRLAFHNSDAPIIAKVGISPVSVENARLNLADELADADFDSTRAKADELWNKQLAKIQIETDDISDKEIFYTALYHSMFAPVVFSDVNGQYRGSDGNIHDTQGEFTNYSIFSLWDTYRAAHPLSTIIHPEIQSDYYNTFINIYDQQGKLPVWHLHGNETDCMVGNSGVIVLGDLVAKGYATDENAAFEAMKNSMLRDERSLADLKKFGFVPYDGEEADESVAKGLEYAIADNAVAVVAARLGKSDDEKYFSDRSKSYRHYFDKDSRFMRAKSKADEFRKEAFDPFEASHRANDYCEGNAWQYIWLVPHDPHGLVELFGSDEAFVEKLDSLFIVEGSLGDDASPDISGLIGQYAHGNEPGHHTVYLYNYAGVPYKAAPLLRKIMNEMYRNDLDGICGNEDVGQMSAWYILSSLGLYQVEPVGGKYVFGTPLFDSATVDVGDGKQFKITARNNSPENIYIKEVILNGRPYNKSYIDYSDIKNGGELLFVMSDKPSPTFGTDSNDRP